MPKGHQSLTRSGCSDWTETLLQRMLGSCPNLCSEAEALTPARRVGWGWLTAQLFPTHCFGKREPPHPRFHPHLRGHPNSRAPCGMSTTFRRGANPQALPKKQRALKSPSVSQGAGPKTPPQSRREKAEIRARARGSDLD